jgi:hypothetical protein
MRWAGQVATMWERRNGYRVLAGKMKRSLGTETDICGRIT